MSLAEMSYHPKVRRFHTPIIRGEAAAHLPISNQNLRHYLKFVLLGDPQIEVPILTPLCVPPQICVSAYTRQTRTTDHGGTRVGQKVRIDELQQHVARMTIKEHGASRMSSFIDANRRGIDQTDCRG
jgi:hypothetical protein